MLIQFLELLVRSFGSVQKSFVNQLEQGLRGPRSRGHLLHNVSFNTLYMSFFSFFINTQQPLYSVDSLIDICRAKGFMLLKFLVPKLTTVRASFCASDVVVGSSLRLKGKTGFKVSYSNLYYTR